MDGVVLDTDQSTAIKALKFQQLYVTERDVYLRLCEKQVQTVAGFDVPEMLGYDDDLWVIEMEIVSPPYVLDFAGAYLDRPPEFPEDVLAQWRAEKQEQFEDDWPTVQKVLREFRAMGIYLSDLNPKNINFGR